MHYTVAELNRLRTGAASLAEVAEAARHAASCEACGQALRTCPCVQRPVRDLRISIEGDADPDHLPEDILMAAVDGLLAGEPLEIARGHLDECRICRTELDELRSLKDDLHGGLGPSHTAVK